MKVIVPTVALLATIALARSAPNDEQIVFLSLQETPSHWLSDKPVNMFVDPFGESHKISESMKKIRSSHRSTSWPLLDFPGPEYQRLRGDLPRPEDLR